MGTKSALVTQNQKDHYQTFVSSGFSEFGIWNSIYVSRKSNVKLNPPAGHKQFVLLGPLFSSFFDFQFCLTDQGSIAVIIEPPQC